MEPQPGTGSRKQAKPHDVVRGRQWPTADSIAVLKFLVSESTVWHRLLLSGEFNLQLQRSTSQAPAVTDLWSTGARFLRLVPFTGLWIDECFSSPDLW